MSEREYTSNYILGHQHFIMKNMQLLNWLGLTQKRIHKQWSPEHGTMFSPFLQVLPPNMKENTIFFSNVFRFISTKTDIWFIHLTWCINNINKPTMDRWAMSTNSAYLSKNFDHIHNMILLYDSSIITWTLQTLQRTLYAL